MNDVSQRQHAHGNATSVNVKRQKMAQRVFQAIDIFEAMIHDDGDNVRHYPKDNACPYIGLRQPFTKSTLDLGETKCRMRLKTAKDCEESIKYYGKPGQIKEVKCDVSKAIEICRIVRANNKKYFDVVCDMNKCEGSSLHLGLLGDQTGVVDSWTLVSDEKQLTKLLLNHASSSKFGASFSLLKCGNKLNFQVLTFPKVLERSTTAHRDQKINFNLIIEDSLSRTHFYRTLSQTATTLRDIIYNKSIPATVLEFQKVQSYGSTTLINLHRLFSGKNHLHESREPIGVEEFFSLFMKLGYNTLFQEDNCFSDVWGTNLEPSYRVGHVKDQITREKVWKEFVNLLETTKRSKYIDDFGVTFLSCSVYATLGTTNVYNGVRFPNVCFAGRHYTSFPLNYAKNYVKLNDGAAKPFLAYTHVVTSHERTGRRIVNDDVTLSELFKEAAYLNNTITVFLSDHGGKSTKFSSLTTQGRYEVFQPILFMIIPHKVSDKLGREVMNALTVNQNRLIGIKDLSDALRSYLLSNKPALGGLFRPILLNRTCEQLNLDSDVLCLCDKMDKAIQNDSEVVKWAAEFALGSLNNRIQDQFIANLKSNHTAMSSYYGYGACRRYTGLRIDFARDSVSGEKQTIAFALFVKPFDRKIKEAFHVTISIPVKRHDGMILEKFTRMSSFNQYEECADENVDPKLCTCDTSLDERLKWRDNFMRSATSKPSFSHLPEILDLDKPCLTILSRHRFNLLSNGKKQTAISTYEAFNPCSYLIYNLTIDVKKSRETRVSRKLPDTVTMFPRTMTFLMTVSNAWKFGKFVPKFSFVKKNFKSGDLKK